MTEPRLLGDRYELGEVLGRGGMAEVRRGRDLRLGRIVAIKMLRVDHAADATFQARFRREAQSAASLNHRNIVAVYDTGEDFIDGHRVPYIVMEYVEGRTLRELLHERARFTPERTIEVTASVLDALEYSHRAGIVHRDIKPGNVMITTGGDVKVMDFGIARSLAETGAALTQTAAVVGTAQYISPEQARGESADARSDLYATGCVMYELLTGRPPFVGESLVSVAVSHVREMVTPPSALDPSIPRDLDAIVLKALAKDRLDRYQSAYEMRGDLERCAAGLPVAAAADATAATQFIGAGYADTMYEPAATAMYDDVVEAYPEEEEREKKGMSWGALIGAAVAILLVAGLIGFLMFRDDENTPQLVRVASLLNMTEEQAQAWATENNVQNFNVEPREVTDESQVGIVLEQDPAPGTDIDPATDPVTVVVGRSPETVEVPDVQGMTVEDATAALEDAGLQVGDQIPQVVENEDQIDTVLSTNPGIGTAVAPDTAVDLNVGAPPESVTIPDLVNVPRDEARDTLLDLDLEVEETQESSSEIDEGRVIRTDPRGGTSVEPGSTVTLVVSSGEELVEVPSVLGFTEDQARTFLEQDAYGFEVDAQPDQNCDEDEGIVISQDPEPGTELARGETVRIGVNTLEGCPTDGNGGNGGNGGGD
ncbi:MAG TPA: Stk1 family PASTA domain-containing Ser/Thr kinase [Jiangellaceae bacterium]|nr:Stk1 family PASTA domain-containing Ser/Thr kinase [Jiangellaceae bacterium]